MQFTTTIITALSLASFTLAAPAPVAEAAAQAQSCSYYPWFIAPYANNANCQGSPAYYQPTSGPYNPNPVATGCRTLSDPNGAPQSFMSLSINREACPQQKWDIKLFTDAKCGTQPVTVSSNMCVAAPAGRKFTSFIAVPAPK